MGRCTVSRVEPELREVSVVSYTKMAVVYDLLMEDAPYDEWEQFTKVMFHRFGTNIKKVADLGCGTGQITSRLAQNGFSMTGIDYSADMLAYAKENAEKNQLNIEWFQQDLRSLAGFQQLDAAISFCDVINYITDKDELNNVFSRVNKLLRMEGLFLFDIHSMHHVENDLKGQTFAEIYEDISYIWLCQPGETAGDIYHDLTFFILDEQQYDRFDEEHHQRTYPLEIYRDLLQRNGLQIMGIFGDFSTESSAVDEADRLFIVCKKFEEAG